MKKSEKGSLQISILKLRLFKIIWALSVCIVPHVYAKKLSKILYAKILIGNSLVELYAIFVFLHVLFAHLDLFYNECVLPLQLRGNSYEETVI